MKTVQNVSIGGYVFRFEEDALGVINGYLDELSSFYSRMESGSEVMEGIEERLSELLLERSGNGGVVTSGIVESAIRTLGRPEAIENESRFSDNSEAQKTGEKSRKRLYRDPSQGKVAGVCSGLGTFFRVDPTAFRLLFVVLTLIGFGLFWRRGAVWHFPDYAVPLFYLVLWICMPAALTVRQKDELRGERGTVDAISARIRDSVHEVGQAAAGNVARSGGVWSDIWRILEVCLGVILLVTGVAGIVTLSCISIGEGMFPGSFFFARVLQTADPDMLELMSYAPIIASFCISVVMPFIGMIYGGIMILFRLKPPKWHPGLCLLVVWLIALVVFIVLVFIRANLLGL